MEETIMSNNGVTHVSKGGSNIFEELGFASAEAETLRIKSELMINITQWIRGQELKQVQAAERLGISRPRVSDIMTGKSWKFTIDFLIDLLEKIGMKVDIKISVA